MKKVLTIAGSDPSGGAGIQADIKTATAHKVYAMSIITALTAQNTMGVDGILYTPEHFLNMQCQSVVSDIKPDAVKIGMLGAPYMYGLIADMIKKHHLKNVVVDPIMMASSGRVLADVNMLDIAATLYKEASLITPNISEAEKMVNYIVNSKVSNVTKSDEKDSKIDIANNENSVNFDRYSLDKFKGINSDLDMEKFAEIIYEIYKTPVLLKGGHRITEKSGDVLFDGKEITWFYRKRIDAKNNHGTGCTLSTAIACNLAKEMSLVDSISAAKDYVLEALKKAPDIGHGCGPLNHFV